MSAETKPDLIPAYAVVYQPNDDGSWRASFVDMPDIVVTAPTFGVVKARIAEAGRRLFEEAETTGQPLSRPKGVVGYAYLDKSDNVCRLDDPKPGLF